MENRIRALKKGSIKGYCRICNQYSTLSLDHIPPKSCGNKSKVFVRIDDNENIFQNGFSCRTICEKCNNELLGAKYDKEFIMLYERIIQHDKSKLYLPNDILPINIDCRSLVRGILGHFLAVTALNGNTSIVEILSKPVFDMVKHFSIFRDFVLGRINYLDDFDIYYWYYPKSEIYISTVLPVVLNAFGSNNYTGEVIKYFPLAIFIVKKQKAKLNLPTIEFNKNVLNLNMTVPPEFPDHPSESGLGFVVDFNNTNVNAVKYEKDQ